MPKLLTRKEYRALFGCSRQSIHNKIKRGTLVEVNVPVQRTARLIVVDDETYKQAVKDK